MTSAAHPMRSSKERPVARVPARRTYCFGMVMVCPILTPSASAAARLVAPTLTRRRGGVRRVNPVVRGGKVSGVAPRCPCTLRRLRRKEGGDKPAALGEGGRAVAKYRVHGEADLVHVRHDHDHGIALTDAHPEIPRCVGLRPCPTGHEPLYGFPHRRLGSGNAVRLDELGDDGLGLGNSARVLYREQGRQCEDHRAPPIHCTRSRTRASTSAKATVSTAVSGSFAATVTSRASSKGPCRFFTLFSPAFEASRLCT